MDPSLKRSQLFRCHAWRHTMNWSLRKFSHAERTGEQVADSSNDSNNVGRAAGMYRPVSSCRTSINFSDITTRWKNQPPQEEVPTFWKNSLYTGAFHPKQVYAQWMLLLFHPIYFGHKMWCTLDRSQRHGSQVTTFSLDYTHSRDHTFNIIKILE